MRLKITKRVTDKQTGELFLKDDEIERSEDRGQDFIKANVAVEIKEQKPEPKKETETTSKESKPKKQRRKSKKSE